MAAALEKGASAVNETCDGCPYVTKRGREVVCWVSEGAAEVRHVGESYPPACVNKGYYVGLSDEREEVEE